MTAFLDVPDHCTVTACEMELGSSQIFEPSREGMVGQVTKVNKMAFNPGRIAALSELLKPPQEDDDSSDVRENFSPSSNKFHQKRI